jgi:hypothetical protein
MEHEFSRVVDALPGVDHGYVEARVAGDPWEEYTMKTVAAPIPFAGSRLGEARHVCAFFHNPDEEYRILLPFMRGSSAATGPSMSSIPRCGRNTSGDWRPPALMWPWQHRAASSSSTIGMTLICAKVISTNMG